MCQVPIVSNQVIVSSITSSIVAEGETVVPLGTVGVYETYRMQDGKYVVDAQLLGRLVRIVRKTIRLPKTRNPFTWSEVEIGPV